DRERIPGVEIVQVLLHDHITSAREQRIASADGDRVIRGLSGGVFGPVDEAEQVALVEVLEPVDLLDDRDVTAQPVHDLARELEAQVHLDCPDVKRRSPGVDTARCLSPTNSGSGCNSAGLGPLNSRSHADDPRPTTQVRPPSGILDPTDRCSPATSPSRSRAVASPSGAIVTTRKIAVPVSGLSTGWAVGPLAESVDTGK